MEYLSFNLLGMIILFNLGNHGFYANVCQSLKGQPFIIQEEFVSSQTNVRWIKDGNDIVVVSVPTDGSQPNCTIFPTTPPAGYTTYCYNNTNYGLELHKPEDHIGSTFNTVPEGKILKDNNCILEIKDPGTVQCSAYNITINDTSVVELNCGVFNTNIDNVNFTLNYNVLEDTFSVPDSGLNIESGNSLYNITTKYEMSKDSPGFSAMTETTTIKALFIVDYGITIDNSTEITIKYTIDIDSPSPSSPSTPTQSSLPPNTSSIASSLTTASLTTSSLTTPCVCVNCDCDDDCLVIIIVMACLGTMIVVVVVLVCCCCPFCLCYKCCKKQRDKDVEGREKSKQTERKNTTRSSQYEMNTSKPQNDRNNRLTPRATQPLHSYQDSFGYQFPRAYQTPRDYHNPRVHESYYGHGYNNAAFYYDENERGRNMARKTRVPQRPYTNNYY